MKKIDLTQFKQLFSLFRKEGYTVIGPTIRDEAIVYDVIEQPNDLPIGWTDESSPGTYRISRRKDQAYFGYNVGPHSWKKYLFPPKRKLWEANRSGNRLSIIDNPAPNEKFVFLGVRACEIEAIFIQDKVFIDGHYVDNYYKAVRDNSLIVAVNCTQAASTCFCTSMQTGPEVTRGYDLSLTEIINSQDHHFLIEAGTEKGNAFLNKVPSDPCDQNDIDAGEKAVQNARDQMDNNLGMDTLEINKVLYRNLEHPQWEKVAERCLSCANCTLVCPTCFCSTIEDSDDLTGDHTERWKSWDSCFNPDHSYIHGGTVRGSTKSRYRQWMTHKLGSWIDQFGTSGCVGCGRCIAWCPVGIDIREEMAAIRATEEQVTEG